MNAMSQLCTVSVLTLPLFGGCIATMDDAGGGSDKDDPVVDMTCGDGGACDELDVEGPSACDAGACDGADGGVAELDASEPPPPPTAFRITDLDLRDPHIFARPLFSCTDLTDSAPFGADSVNEGVQKLIGTDEDRDGLLDLSGVILFEPLELGEEGEHAGRFTIADCTAPVSTTECQPKEEVFATELTYTNQSEGTCLSPHPGTTYGYWPGITSPEAPCFVTAPRDVRVSLGDIDVPLSHAQLAGRFHGIEAVDRIEDGLLMGFLSEADANRVFLPNDIASVTGVRTLGDLLPGDPQNCSGRGRDNRDDVDGDGSSDGWWFYLNYRAARVPWSEDTDEE